MCWLCPRSIACQGGCSDPHRIVPRVHHSQLTASVCNIILPGYAVVQLLRHKGTQLDNPYCCAHRTQDSQRLSYHHVFKVHLTLIHINITHQILMKLPEVSVNRVFQIHQPKQVHVSLSAKPSYFVLLITIINLYIIIPCLYEAFQKQH